METADYGAWNDNQYDNQGNKLKRPSPPALLELALQCRRWKSLPKSGGILDQPYGLMSKLEVLLTYFDAEQAYASAPAKDFGKFIADNPSIMNVKNSISDIRKKYG